MKPTQFAAFITASVMSLQVSTTFAQPDERGMPREPGQMHGMHGMGMMSQMDGNGDGAISRAEYIQAHEQMFARMDQNGDGSITQDEMTQEGAGMMGHCMMNNMMDR